MDLPSTPRSDPLATFGHAENGRGAVPNGHNKVTGLQVIHHEMQGNFARLKICYGRNVMYNKPSVPIQALNTGVLDGDGDCYGWVVTLYVTFQNKNSSLQIETDRLQFA